jgi:tetratricopeptide (TPR) repeat protein
MVSTLSRIQLGRRCLRALNCVVALVLACGLLALLVGPVASAATRTANAQEARQPALVSIAASKPVVSGNLGNLEHRVENLEKLVNLVFVPITVLIGVLSAGGVIGVVFSIRDQRRVSQLHELTVAGEVSSQRRSEQSYGSFLEQSQTTIGLVNDTLRLAKEASDREARSGRSKANERVKAIEEQSETLMLQIFRGEDFELILDHRDHRRELNRIGLQLREFETSQSLLDEVELPPYTKFVKAMNQFMKDDTEAAINDLRRASQNNQINNLHRFTLYWLGYMLTTVGEYQEAVTRFRDDEIGLPKDDAERLQLERMIAETEFFRRGKPAEEQKGKLVDNRTPQQRFRAIADVLDHLSILALEVKTIRHSTAKWHTSLEIAQTRADILAWIAYDPERLDEPIPKDPDSDAHEIAILPPPGETYRANRDDKLGPAGDFAARDFEGIEDGHPFRIWAMSQAQAICEAEERKPEPTPEEREGLAFVENVNESPSNDKKAALQPSEEQPKVLGLNFYVTFALAECYFKLGHSRASQAFRAAETALDKEFGEFLEKRREAMLQESLLICHSRDLFLKHDDADVKVRESKTIRQASREANKAVQDMHQPSVTVFSQIQRRNISQDEFRLEINAIVKQEEKQLEE